MDNMDNKEKRNPLWEVFGEDAETVQSAPSSEEVTAEAVAEEDASFEDVSDEEMPAKKTRRSFSKRSLGKPKQSFLADVYDWLEVFAVSIAAVFILFSFVVRVAEVDGDSMCNTLYDGERLLVRELFYTPKQGDVVVCQTEYFGFEKPIVKRVIATEGQTVSIDRETWTVTVDGVALEEDYVLRIPYESMDGWSYGDSYTVPEGHVFVMGDNRNNSGDSRDSKVGPIDERYIIGKVFFRFAPFDRFGPVN